MAAGGDTQLMRAWADALAKGEPAPLVSGILVYHGSHIGGDGVEFKTRIKRPGGHAGGQGA